MGSLSINKQTYPRWIVCTNKFDRALYIKFSTLFTQQKMNWNIVLMSAWWLEQANGAAAALKWKFCIKVSWIFSTTVVTFLTLSISPFISDFFLSLCLWACVLIFSSSFVCTIDYLTFTSIYFLLSFGLAFKVFKLFSTLTIFFSMSLILFFGLLFSIDWFSFLLYFLSV